MAGASQLAGGETPGGRSAWAAGTPSDPPSQALQPPFPQLGPQGSCTPALAPQPSLKLCRKSSLQTNLVRSHHEGKVPIVLTWNTSHPATSSAPAAEATEGGGLSQHHRPDHWNQTLPDLRYGCWTTPQSPGPAGALACSPWAPSSVQGAHSRWLLPSSWIHGWGVPFLLSRVLENVLR